MIAGWFVGDFFPSTYRTKDFEVGYKLHKKNEQWPVHFHKRATEINLLVKGKMTICGETIEPGQIFVIDQNEIAAPIFLEDCELVVVKTISDVNDKYIVE